MAHQLIEAIEKDQMKESAADIQVGDTVRVSQLIVEGKKQRTQRYEGVVIKVQNARSRQRFTVRKIVDKIGVEKAFMTHSPLVQDIEIVKRASVRRARLFYLRDRVGTKATRLKTKED